MAKTEIECADDEIQVAFEANSLDAAVHEVMQLALELGHKVITSVGTGQAFDATNADQVRDYIVLTSQSAYTDSGDAAVDMIRKMVFGPVGVAFEPIEKAMPGRLIFSRTGVPPSHVAAFWRRLGTRKRSSSVEVAEATGG